MSDPVTNALVGMNSALRNLRLYPPEHSLSLTAVERAYGLLNLCLDESGDLTLGISGNKAIHAGRILYESEKRAESIMSILSEAGITWLRISTGISQEELGQWLLLLSEIDDDRMTIHSWEGEHIHHGAGESESANARSERGLLLMEIVFRGLQTRKQLPYDDIRQFFERQLADIRKGYPPLAVLELSLGQDNYLIERGLLVSALSMVIGRCIGLDDEMILQLGAGGMLCDIGLIDVDNSILSSHQGGTEIIPNWDDHAVAGARILAKIGAPSVSVVVAAEHHWGLKVASPARHPVSVIVGMADDLIGRILGGYGCSQRRLDLALIDLWKEGEHYPPLILNSLMKMSGIFEIDTVIRLSNRKQARIVEVNATEPIRPKVVLLDDESTIIDLSSPEERVTISAVTIE